MSFTQGLSGLNAAGKSLDVIGNNVANANTVGFKGSQAQFADVFAAALSGGGSATIGIGAQLATVAQQFTQGNISITNNTLDMAINGAGFFIMDNGHGTGYTRNGQFQLDKNGFIVSSTGHKLLGRLPDATGKMVGSPVPLTIPTGIAAAKVTGNIFATMNLDSRLPVIPAATVFDPQLSGTYNSQTSITTYDSLGNAQIANIYFRNASNLAPNGPNTWDIYATISDPNAPVTVPPTLLFPVPPALAAGSAPIGQVVFNENGTTAPTAATIAAGTVAGYTPNAANPLTFLTFVPSGSATETIGFDFSTATQFGANFGVTKLTQDGYTSGQLSGFNVSPDGTILGRYSNGVASALGQVALATFSNMQGLQPLGMNEWAESGASGQPTINAPGQANNGVIQTSSVEDSNTDLTAELVNMITAQRVYQANAQTIKTMDSIMQTLVNLR